MLRLWLRQSLVYSLAAASSSLLSLALLPLYARRLSPADLGAFDLLQAVIVLSCMILPLEIVQAMARDYPEVQDESRRRVLTATSWWFTVAVYSLAVLVAIPLGSRISPWLLGDTRSTPLTALAVAAVWASGLSYYCGNQFRWQMQPGAFAAFNFGRAFLTHGISVVLTVAWDAGLTGVVAGHLLGNGIPVVAWALRSREPLRTRPDRRVLVELLKFSAPIVPASVSIFAALWVDRLAISRLMTLSDVGRYGVALRFASAVTLVSMGFQQALMPILFQRHREPETPAQLARLFRGATAVSLAAMLLLDLFGRDLLTGLVTETYWDVDGVISLLSAAACAMSLAMFAPGLTIAKQTGRSGVIYTIGAAVNTVLNFALIPHLGLHGAALATLCGSLVTLLLCFRASQAVYPVPYRFGSLLAWATPVLAMIAVNRFVPSDLCPALLETVLGRAACAALAILATAAGLFGLPEWLGSGPATIDAESERPHRTAA